MVERYRSAGVRRRECVCKLVRLNSSLYYHMCATSMCVSGGIKIKARFSVYKSTSLL